VHFPPLLGRAPPASAGDRGRATGFLLSPPKAAGLRHWRRCPRPPRPPIDARPLAGNTRPRLNPVGGRARRASRRSKSLRVLGFPRSVVTGGRQAGLLTPKPDSSTRPTATTTRAPDNGSPETRSTRSPNPHTGMSATTRSTAPTRTGSTGGRASSMEPRASPVAQHGACGPWSPSGEGSWPSASAMRSGLGSTSPIITSGRASLCVVTVASGLRSKTAICTSITVWVRASALVRA